MSIMSIQARRVKVREDGWGGKQGRKEGGRERKKKSHLYSWSIRHFPTISFQRVHFCRLLLMFSAVCFASVLLLCEVLKVRKGRDGNESRMSEQHLGEWR